VNRAIFRAFKFDVACRRTMFW